MNWEPVTEMAAARLLIVLIESAKILPVICNEAGVPSITISPILTELVPIPVAPVTLMAPPLVFTTRSVLATGPETFPARAILPPVPPSKVVSASTKFKLPVILIPDWVSTLTEVSLRS